MDNSDANVTVSNNISLQRFEAWVAGYQATLEYDIRGQSIVFKHTEVPKPIERNGIGSALARAGLDYATEHGLTVVPLCPFVEHYIRAHPEYLRLVEPTYRQRRFAARSSGVKAK